MNDKLINRDIDEDGTVDACDLDSDNDGVLDSEEDTNANSEFLDDEGDSLPLGDGVSNTFDLDSDNDTVLDLMEGRPLSQAEINVLDSDHNGVFDEMLSYGLNGFLDLLETTPDSGVLRPELLALRNTDGDDRPDMLDTLSDGNTFDMYLVGNDGLDIDGGGFLSVINDPDRDGVQIQVDHDPAKRGSPASPYSPHSS